MFEIYGTLDCTYCDMAKKLLAVYEKEYAFIDVIENDDITAAFFKKFPNVNQVPQIIEGDHYIGGFNELKQWLNHIE